MKHLLTLAGFLSALLLTTTSSAGEPEYVYRKHSVVTFGDHLIDGRLQKADVQWIRVRTQQDSNRLVVIRQNFRREILSSLRR